MNPVINLNELTKVFSVDKGKSWWRSLISPTTETRAAVDGISFSVEKGEFVGFLGPNGAGKSTTIKMLTGILTPTSGQITVNGLVPWKDRRVHALQIGVVFGQRTQLWWDLPPRDSFRLLAKIYRVTPRQFNRNMEEFCDVLGLGEFMKTPVRKLSLGQKMRCELAAALLHNPEILFLDEPTIGLDVFAKESIRNFLKELNRSKQVTVILTTHDLDDVEDLCERVLIIDKGSVIEDGTLSSLKESFGGEKIIAFELDPRLKPVLPEGAGLIKSEANIHYVSCSGSTPALISAMLQNNRIHDISFVPQDIAEIVKRAYQRSAERGLTNRGK